MKPALEDLRILLLAQMYERAYESFAESVAARMTEPGVRDLLRALAPRTDDHSQRLRALIERTISTLGPADRRAAERAALLAVVEAESDACDFYLQHVDRVHDPAVARLFRELAREETQHVGLAEAALDAHEAAGKTARP